MAEPFIHRRRIEFAETDMAGIVHFANYFRYMETAEHAYFRSLGHTVHGEVDGRMIGFPRVDVSCTFRAPLKFEDDLETHVYVRAMSDRSLTFEHLFIRAGDEPTEVARGRMTIVCVAMDSADGKLKAVPIPASIAERIVVIPE